VYMEKFQGFMRRRGWWVFLAVALAAALGIGGYLAYVNQWLAL